LYESNLSDESGMQDLSVDMFNLLVDVISDDWMLYDGYFYYIGNMSQPQGASGGGVLLKEVDATSGDVVVNFINEPIIFPTYVDKSYSQMGLKFIITFQAIQNYIPDESGNRLENTIDNSLKIFEFFDSGKNQPTSIEYFNVTLQNGEYIIDIKDVSTMPSTVVLPSTDANGNEITKLGTSFGGNCGNIKKLVIPSTYTLLADNAFKGTTISEVDMSDSQIEVIPDSCFSSSSLQSIKLPETLKQINYYAFNNTKLTSITIPEGCTTIEDSAIWSNQVLLTIYISSTVSSIGRLGNAPALRKIVVNQNNQYFYDVDDLLLIGKDGVLYAGAVYFPTKSLILPEEVVELGTYSLYASKLDNLGMSKRLSIIGDSGLPQTLKSVDIPVENNNFKTSAGYDLYNKSGVLLKIFPHTTSWHNYTMPDEITSVDSRAFTNAFFDNLIIGKGLKSWTASTLRSSHVNNLEVHSENTKFKVVNNALIFNNTELCCVEASILDIVYTVPSIVKTIDPYAFDNHKNITEIIIPEGATRIEYSAFYYASKLNKITIPSTMTFIGQGAFENTQIELLTLYGKLTTGSLRNMPKLAGVLLKSSVTEIGANLCSNCKSLQWVEFEQTTPPTFKSNILFDGCPTSFKIYVPDSALSAYKAVANLASYKDKIYAVSQM
jgi:hypothetical protein